MNRKRRKHHYTMLQRPSRRSVTQFMNMLSNRFWTTQLCPPVCSILRESVRQYFCKTVQNFAYRVGLIHEVWPTVISFLTLPVCRCDEVEKSCQSHDIRLGCFIKKMRNNKKNGLYVLTYCRKKALQCRIRVLPWPWTLPDVFLCRTLRTPWKPENNFLQ